MPRINLYNVYDEGKLIMEKVTRREIVDRIGCDKISLTRYATEGVTYQNRYKFEFCDEHEKRDTLQEIIFKEQWERAVAPFKRVMWVKSGGKQLKSGGTRG